MRVRGTRGRAYTFVQAPLTDVAIGLFPIPCESERESGLDFIFRFYLYTRYLKRVRCVWAHAHAGPGGVFISPPACHHVAYHHAIHAIFVLPLINENPDSLSIFTILTKLFRFSN